MAITEKSRHKLHQGLEEVLGDDNAATLMEHLPPVGWAYVATKRDIEALKQDIAALSASTKRDIEALKDDIGALAAATKRDIGALAAATKRDIDALAAGTKRDSDVLENSLRLSMQIESEKIGKEMADLSATVSRELLAARHATWGFIVVVLGVVVTGLLR